MTPLLAHIAGIPVEETLLTFGPFGVAGLSALAFALRSRARVLRERLARRVRGT